VSMTGLMVVSLKQALADLAGSPLVATDRKTGVRRAVEIAMLGAKAAPALENEHKDAITGLDGVLLKVAQLQGNKGLPQVEQAKVWLRARGKEGHTAASMLGRLSQLRNRQAHPLAGRIIAMLETLGEGEKAEETEKQDEKKTKKQEGDEEADKTEEQGKAMAKKQDIQQLEHDWNLEQGPALEEKTQKARQGKNNSRHRWRKNPSIKLTERMDALGGNMERCRKQIIALEEKDAEMLTPSDEELGVRPAEMETFYYGDTLVETGCQTGEQGDSASRDGIEQPLDYETLLDSSNTANLQQERWLNFHANLQRDVLLSND